MSKHSFGNQRQRFSIRKFSVGVASVLVGMAIFGAQTAHAEENQPAESVLETPVEKSDGAAEDLTAPVDKENVNEDDIAAKPIPVVAASSAETPAEMTTEADYTRRAGHLGAVTSVEADATNANVFNVTYETGQKGRLSFYNDHVVRYHVVEGNAEFKETPAPSREDRPASIVTKKLSDYPAGTAANLTDSDKEYTIQTDRVELRLNKEHSLLTIVDKKNNKVVVKETAPIEFAGDTSTQTLASDTTSQYFGGGTQNGRFTHKGEVINIVNENKWTDKGVASPNPFYWTTQGYGVLRHTFKPGQYDFEKTEDGKVITKHADRNFDAFYFINDKPEALLKDYYELTGKPVVLPIFALYEGHLNAYNRDYWVEVPANTPGGIYFEEKGKWYKEYQPSALGDKQGIRETLHSEKTAENYPFTATAVLDRYIKNDMPIGWILVNDGYGAGYGQTDTLEGNIENLKKFSEEALKKGIKTGLWTQSDLHPNSSQPALLQRDLPAEVRDAMVRILKTDVAWVGPGYSFGLNGIADAAKIMTEQGQNARPFIITLDGWGGTQRHGGIWTGDQTGGQWEYIRFHIPTYIGTGLSGQPNVSSDMDGIFGGGNKVINVRDHQWKVFTPMMLQMDGWGRNPKNPYAFDQTSTDINRTYLKMKAALVPYAYSISHEAREGKPVVRAMFLEFPDQAINYTKAVQYQFMYGENFLVAPVYENVKGDANGNDVRNGIYLPKGAEWIDYFTGEIYKGGQTLNDFDAPIWKLPIFVKNGAIIPITKEHNNYTQINHGLRQVDFYPHGSTKFTLVEDDGLTEDYTKDKVAKTQILSHQQGDMAVLVMNRTVSNYDGFVKEKASQFNVNVSREPEVVKLLVDTKEVALTKVTTLEAFEAGENVYFYDATPNLNRFATEGSGLASVDMTKNPVLRVKSAKLDVTQHSVSLAIKGFANDKMAQKEITSTSGQTPTPTVVENSVSPTSLTVTWGSVPNAETYDIEVDGVLNTNLKEPTFKHKEQAFGSEHTYRVRARIGNVVTEWSEPLIASTSANPLVNAIDDIQISSDREAQPGTPHKYLVDKDEATMYHSKWGVNSVPELLRLDLGMSYDLDKLEYVPRDNAGNGNITSSRLYWSVDGNNWKSLTQPLRWARNSDRKTFEFPEGTKARYLALRVEEAVGNFVSGQELLIFKKEGTVGRVVGDVTGDGAIDQNDVVSLTNYAGLRRNIDSDFKGYVEVADLNENNVIDAYDTYYVTRQLGEGAPKTPKAASGHLTWVADKTNLAASEEVTISLVGKGLTNVEAIYANYAIDKEKYEVVGDLGVDRALESMTNFSLIRTHGDSSQEAFVVLSNKKDAPTISGNHTIATFKLRSKVAQTLALPEATTFVVGSDMQPVDGSVETPVPAENESRMVEASRISVSGKDVYQSGQGLDNLIDNNPATLTELKWNYEPNFVNGVLPAEITLPQDIQFDFDKSQPTLLESMMIRKRTPGNGTVSKYKVTAYRGDEVVYASEEMPVDFATAEIVHNFDKVRQVDRVVLTVLEAKTNATTVNNRMMTLKDVVFYEKPSALVAEPISGDKLTITGAGVYQAGHDVDKLIDGNEASLTELKWDISNNHVNGKLPAEVSLPQDITITPKDGGKLYLTGYELTKRTPGNGTVTKYKVSVYNGDDLVFDTGEVATSFTEAKSDRHFDQPLEATKVILTVLEARTDANTVRNQMMTLKEFRLFKVDPDLLPANLVNRATDQTDNQLTTNPASVEDLSDSFTATKPASEADVTAALTSDAYLRKEYKVFPTPQSVTYGDKVVRLDKPVNLVIGDYIDVYTKNRLKSVLQANNISYHTGTASETGSVNLYLGVANQETKAKEHQETSAITNGLYDKIDAYSLVIKDNAISVVGKDTDAVFYGLTTLKHMLNESEVPVLREVKVEDYADMKNRGFIEGYYGNPWSNQDRAELMRFGGDLKMTQYFFAPKDDVYHNSQWRDLYPDDKLEEIRELARVGNATKTRYVWTIHPFMHNSIRFNSDANYEEDLNVIKAKFSQLMAVGVREFGILADDARTPVGGTASYNRLMTDLTNWLTEQQSQYPGLRKEMVFVPHEYWGRGNEAELRSLNKNLPASSNLVLTGGKIWGEVSENFLTNLKTNLTENGDTYRPVQLWINWPCTDNSKQHLILGGGEKFLHPGVDPSLLAGIMLNPMQQSEPSKIALFSAAEYTWNVWDSEDAARKVNDIAFNFVETGRFTSTNTSEAFRELAKHMINQNMDSRVVKLEESIALAPKLTSFLDKLSNGEDLTTERDTLRQEFATLKAAAELYKQSGHERMKEQIRYWLDNTIDQMTALDLLLKATEYIGTDNNKELWENYHAGLQAYNRSKEHKFWYVSGYQNAELGVQHIRPFILKTLDALSKEVRKSLNPEEIVTTFISNRHDGKGSGELVLDGDLSTQRLFDAPNSIAVGDYVGLQFNKLIPVNSLAFAMGATTNLRDTFTKADIEYLNSNNEWVKLEGHTFTGNEPLIQLDNLHIEAKAVRLVAKAGKSDTWLGVREIAVNRTLSKDNDRVATNITHSDNLVYKQNTNQEAIIDGKDRTEAMFANADTTGAKRDTTPVGAWVQLNLPEALPVTQVRLVQGRGDKLTSGVLEYSTDGTNWTTLATLSGEQTKELDTTITAKYIRVRNTAEIPLWWRVADFSVVTNTGTTEYTDTNVSRLSGTRVFASPGHYAMTLDATSTLQPKEYIGLKLERLHQLGELAVATPANDKLALIYSANGVEWYPASEVTKHDLVRYVRLVNLTEETQVLGTGELTLTTKEVLPNALVSTTLEVSRAYGSNDVRNRRNLADLFDGNLTNFVEFADTPTTADNIILKLGTPRPIQKIRAYIQDGTQNYLRDGKIQISADGKEWTDVVTVGDGLENPRRDDSLTDGWTHDSQNPGNRYIEGTLSEGKMAQYLRVVFTADYPHRFVGFTELVINDNEYVKSVNDPRVQGNGGESHQSEMAHIIDSQVLTSYAPNEAKGEWTYHLSENTEVNHIRMIANVPADTKVMVYGRVVPKDSAPKAYDGKVRSEWIALGTLTDSFQTWRVPNAYSHLLDVKVVWEGGRPEFYELATFYRAYDEEEYAVGEPLTHDKPTFDETQLEEHAVGEPLIHEKDSYDETQLVESAVGEPLVHQLPTYDESLLLDETIEWAVLPENLTHTKPAFDENLLKPAPQWKAGESTTPATSATTAVVEKGTQTTSTAREAQQSVKQLPETSSKQEALLSLLGLGFLGGVVGLSKPKNRKKLG